MPNALYETLPQGIMVVVSIKTKSKMNTMIPCRRVVSGPSHWRVLQNLDPSKLSQTLRVT